VTVQEAIESLESQGWRQSRSEGSYRQFTHESRPGIVSLSGKLDLEVPPGVLRSLWQQTQIEEDD
jgi:predicted RNA binding protein YcfA (HicA-like mRNA interferase family)